MYLEEALLSLHSFILYFKKMNKEKHLETILILILALIIFYWVRHAKVFLTIAAMLAFIGAFIPWLSKYIHLAWMKLGQAIGYVMSKVLLTIVYMCFLLPLSYLTRIFNTKNGVILKPNSTTYFKNRNFTYTKESIENVW